MTPYKPESISLLTRLRQYLLSGFLLVTPLALTFYLVSATIHAVDQLVSPLIKKNSFLSEIPGLGIVLVLLFLILIGAVAGGFMGRFFVSFAEKSFAHMPIVRTIYGASKQMLETIFRRDGSDERQVGLIEYPRAGSWTICFVTGPAGNRIAPHVGKGEVMSVFVPTTPNPTSGFLLFMKKEDITLLKLSVEEGIKMVMSAGMVTPTKD